MNAFKKYCMNKGLLNTSANVDKYHIEYSFNAERGYFIEHSDVMITLVVVLRNGARRELDLSDFNTYTQPFAVYDWDAVHRIVELLQRGMIYGYTPIKKINYFDEFEGTYGVMFGMSYWSADRDPGDYDPDCDPITVTRTEIISPRLAAEIILDKVLRPTSWFFTDELNHALFNNPYVI